MNQFLPSEFMDADEIAAIKQTSFLYRHKIAERETRGENISEPIQTLENLLTTLSSDKSLDVSGMHELIKLLDAAILAIDEMCFNNEWLHGEKEAAIMDRKNFYLIATLRRIKEKVNEELED